MKKPIACHQNWIEMEEVPGGRLCAKCSQTIVDFREMSWIQIKRIQNLSGNRTCGAYTPEQLENWMPDSPIQENQSLLKGAFTSLLLMGTLISQNGHAQEQNTLPGTSLFALSDHESEVEVQQPNTDTSKTIIRGKVWAPDDVEPIAFAKVYLEGTRLGAATDFDGFFSLEVPDTLLNFPITLITSYVGYQRVELTFLDKSELNEPLHITFTDEIEITAFYVSVPTKREERKIKRIKRREARKAHKTQKKP